MSNASRERLLLLFALLLCFGLSLPLLDRYPLREDEALYSYWALHLRYTDPWMLTVWPDKPPLYLWSQAALFSVLGATAATARLLNIGVTTVTVALLATTSRRLWRDNGTVIALLYALNPFVLSFAATAYTDPLLLFCGQLAFYLALRGRLVSAGMALGAAMMTKQQGLLYTPLLVMVALDYPIFRPTVTTPISLRLRIGRLALLAAGIALILLPLLYGDSLRWSVAPSPWDLSVRNYGGLTLVSPLDWWTRARQWAALLWYIGGSWPAWTFYGTLTLCALGWGRWHGIAHTQARLGWLALWLLGFLALHLITTIQLWDRYLLPLIPIALLLLSGLVATRPIPRLESRSARGPAAGALLGLLLLTPTAWHAAQGGLPIGGDHGAYSGLSDALARVRAIAPSRAGQSPLILYQQRLGWQLQFYLFEEARQGQIEVRWFANAVTLADNAAKSPGQRRFLLQPSWQPVDNFALHLMTRGLQVIQQQQIGKMLLIELEAQPQRPCDWCLCQLNEQPAITKPVSTESRSWLMWPTIAPESRAQICTAGE